MSASGRGRGVRGALIKEGKVPSGVMPGGEWGIVSLIGRGRKRRLASDVPTAAWYQQHTSPLRPPLNLRRSSTGA